MKITELLRNYKIVASGFKAITELSSYSQGTEEIILSSLAPNLLQQQGVTEYYALEISRNTTFTSGEEIIVADLTVNKFHITTPMEECIKQVIVSRHEGTIAILQKKYPSAILLEGNIDTESIKGKHVIGTLPPTLIVDCAAYTAVTISNFDYINDGDLQGSELEKRIQISDVPLKLSKVD